MCTGRLLHPWGWIWGKYCHRRVPGSGMGHVFLYPLPRGDPLKIRLMKIYVQHYSCCSNCSDWSYICNTIYLVLFDIMNGYITAFLYSYIQSIYKFELVYYYIGEVGYKDLHWVTDKYEMVQEDIPRKNFSISHCYICLWPLQPRAYWLVIFKVQETVKWLYDTTLNH